MMHKVLGLIVYSITDIVVEFVLVFSKISFHKRRHYQKLSKFENCSIF